MTYYTIGSIFVLPNCLIEIWSTEIFKFRTDASCRNYEKLWGGIWEGALMTKWDVQSGNGFTAGAVQVLSRAVQFHTSILVSAIVLGNLLGACTENIVAPTPAEFVDLEGVAVKNRSIVLPDESSVVFTTEGKLTKTVETPWGLREVYDPLQDQSVQASFSNIFDYGKLTFGLFGISSTINHPFDEAYRADVELLKAAKRTHVYDLMRLGCKAPKRLPIDRRTEHFEAGCSKYSFGEDQLSDCERENANISISHMGINHRIVRDKKYAGKFYFPRAPEGVVWGYLPKADPEGFNPYAIEARSYISEINIPTVEAALFNFFKQECIKWDLDIK